MAGKTLDRSRAFGTVYGAHDGSMYHQDGVCFRHDGSEVGSEPAPVVNGGPPETAAKGTSLGAPIPDQAEGVTREELEGMHPSQIKSLILNEGLEPATGKGSKAANIDALLLNAAGG